MSELAPPLTRHARARARLQRIEDTQALIARLQSQVRLQLNALSSEDTPGGQRAFLCDELALALAESPGTAERMLLTAQRFSAFPAVVARVGLPLADGGWSIRHADALLDQLAGLGLTPEREQQVVDLVVAHPDARTPHQVRQATRAAVIVVDPAAAERRLEQARKDRRVFSEDFGTGQAFFGASGTTTQIAMVMASIDALTGPKQPGDPRSLDQRRFDAFMDLICGRAVPRQWQALIVVPLSVLQGSDEPAEVPGLGLISAGEARDVLAHAELRRAVVDDHGQLVQVDTTTHRPDLPAIVPVSEPDPDLQLSLDPEPAPLDTTPEHPLDDHDAHWLHQQLDAPDPTDPAVEAAVQRFASELETALTALLDTDLLDTELVTAGRRRTSTAGCHTAPRSRATIEITGWAHRGPDTPPDHWGDGTSPGPVQPPAGPSPGPEPDPDPDPEPEPPSTDDLAWHDATVDRTAPLTHQPPPRYDKEPPGPARPTPATTSWTRQALDAAHARLRSDPLDQRPLTSTAYALPPRLARHVKHRDITCTFPGCPRLARHCQNDHLIPWPHGASEPDNISSECTHHHQAKHTCFTAQRTPDGSIRWTSPLGRVVTRHPRPLLRGW